MATRVVTAHLPEDLAERMDATAERLDRSRGWIVKQAVADWLALEDDRRRLTLEALASVERGDTVPQSAIEAWVATLPE